MCGSEREAMRLVPFRSAFPATRNAGSPASWLARRMRRAGEQRSCEREAGARCFERAPRMGALGHKRSRMRSAVAKLEQCQGQVSEYLLTQIKSPP